MFALQLPPSVKIELAEYFGDAGVRVLVCRRRPGLV